MKKEFKLKKSLDLIKIYESGQWESFEEAYNTYKSEIREYFWLFEYFEQNYFKELYYRRSQEYRNLVSESYKKDKEISEKMSESHYESYFGEMFDQKPIEERLKIVYGPTDYLSKKNIFADKNFERFNYLSNKYLRNYKTRTNRFYEGCEEFLKSINVDNDKLEFFNRYFKSLFKPDYKVVTTIEEAQDYNYQPVLDFLNKNLGRAEKRYSFYKYLGKKLKLLREQRDLTISQMALLLDISDNELITVEKNGRNVTLKLLINYSNVFDMKIDDFIGNKEVVRKLVEKEKEDEMINIINNYLDGLVNKYNVKGKCIRALKQLELRNYYEFNVFNGNVKLKGELRIIDEEVELISLEIIGE